MSPTIVLKDGRPVLTVGAAGGPKIITQTVLAIVRHLDLDFSIDEALAGYGKTMHAVDDDDFRPRMDDDEGEEEYDVAASPERPS